MMFQVRAGLLEVHKHAFRFVERTPNRQRASGRGVGTTARRGHSNDSVSGRLSGHLRVGAGRSRLHGPYGSGATGVRANGKPR